MGIEGESSVAVNTILFVVFMVVAYSVLYAAGIAYVATLFVIVILVALLAYIYWRVRNLRIQAEMRKLVGNIVEDVMGRVFSAIQKRVNEKLFGPHSDLLEETPGRQGKVIGGLVMLSGLERQVRRRVPLLHSKVKNKLFGLQREVVDKVLAVKGIDKLINSSRVNDVREVITGILSEGLDKSPIPPRLLNGNSPKGHVMSSRSEEFEFVELDEWQTEEVLKDKIWDKSPDQAQDPVENETTDVACCSRASNDSSESQAQVLQDQPVHHADIVEMSSIMDDYEFVEEIDLPQIKEITVQKVPSLRRKVLKKIPGIVLDVVSNLPLDPHQPGRKWLKLAQDMAKSPNRKEALKNIVRTVKPLLLSRLADIKKEELAYSAQYFT